MTGTENRPPKARGGVGDWAVDTEKKVSYTVVMDVPEYIDHLTERAEKAERALAQISVEMGPLIGPDEQTHVDNVDSVIRAFEAIKGRTARIRTILKDAGFPTNERPTQ